MCDTWQVRQAADSAKGLAAQVQTEVAEAEAVRSLLAASVAAAEGQLAAAQASLGELSQGCLEAAGEAILQASELRSQLQAKAAELDDRWAVAKR